MSDKPWDGSERRGSNMVLQKKLDDLHDSVLKIQTKLFENGIVKRLDDLLEKMDGHIDEDDEVHKKVERHDAYIAIIVGVFVLAAIGTIATNILRSSGIQAEEGNKGYVYQNKEAKE